MNPQGTLFIIGGAEDKVGQTPDVLEQTKEFDRYAILNALVPSAKNKTVEIVTTGSEVMSKIKATYQKVFVEMGYPNIGFIPIKNRREANNHKYVKRVEKAGTVFFTGGDQFRLSTILGGTSFIDITKERYLHDKDFIIAGTSAGAMAMSTVMITSGGLSEALIYRNLHTSSGLGFLNNCIIDTHFIKRGRFGRLAHAIIMNPEQLGIGLGEDTALIIRHGTEGECFGSGMVVIIDGKNITQTNITDVEGGEPVYVENLTVHLLVKGCKFSLNTRKLLHISPQPGARL